MIVRMLSDWARWSILRRLQRRSKVHRRRRLEWIVIRSIHRVRKKSRVGWDSSMCVRRSLRSPPLYRFFLAYVSFLLGTMIQGECLLVKYEIFVVQCRGKFWIFIFVCCFRNADARFPSLSLFLPFFSKYWKYWPFYSREIDHSEVDILYILST